MNSWASRRKAIYMVVITLVMFAVSFAVFWTFWYQAPSCFDNEKNGDETGVDCGGSCVLVCSQDIMKPIIIWDPRLFEVMPGTWSALVYVENPNIYADAINAPYSFTIYDENNAVLARREGATILPKNKTIGIFEGTIMIDEKVRPKRAVFELGNEIVWRKNENPSENITITHSSLLRLDTSPRVEANVKNNTTKEIKNIELVIAVFDGADNAIAASRTYIESIKKGESSNIFFTWPKPFELGSKVCEKPSDIMLLLDRSGSMASLGRNPAQPLTSVKEAAISFIERLNSKDKVGVSSFATDVKDPIDLILTSDFGSAKSAVSSLSIGSSGTQYTNVYSALHSAWEELVSARANEDYNKVAVLLTDGVATAPFDPLGITEDDNIKYAEGVAVKEATEMKKNGVSIYTIGLGNKINEAFLKTISSGQNYYFYAPTAADLETIYKNVSSDICKEMPARIEITYKIFGEPK